MAVQKKELLAPDILALKVFLAMKKISKVPPFFLLEPTPGPPAGAPCRAAQPPTGVFR